MAQSSSLEKAKLQLKKYKKAQVKKQLAENLLRADIGEKAYAELQRHKNQRTTESKARTAMWDYDHHQYPRIKHKQLAELLKLRLEESPGEKEIDRINKILKRIQIKEGK